MQRVTRSIATCSAAVLLAALAGCSDSPTTPPDDQGIPVPTVYTFDSRFAPGTSSVSYEGQIVRQLLIQDLSSALSALAKPGATPVTAEALLKYYEHADADNMVTRTTVDGRTLLETQYNRISTGKKLADKISPATVIGYGTGADGLVRGWIDRIAANSQDQSRLGTASVLLDDNGVDLSQMINKVLLGSVAYYQGTSVYLANILSKDNAVAADDGKGGKLPYSVMEHNWDEAFGYFGAARDYARYSDAQLAGSSAEYSYDSNGDGRIDVRSEYNFAFARNAGKRDAAGGTDFTKEAFDALLRGRTAIVNEASTDAVVEQRRLVAAAWENVIAATVVHYLKSVLSQMDKLGTAQATPNELSKVWSEGKGYLVALQFNSMKRIGDQQLAQLHQLVGPQPVFAAPSAGEHTQYRAALTVAIQLLKSTYGFTDAQINAW